MRLRIKILFIFFLSLIISIVAFITTALYINEQLDVGYSPLELRQLAREVGDKLQESEDSITGTDISSQKEQVLKRWIKLYPDLEIDYISENGRVLFSSSGRKGNYPLLEIIEDIDNTQNDNGNKLISAKVNLNQESDALVLIKVPEYKITPIQVILHNRGSFTVFLVLISALIIPILISGLSAYLFTYNINRRFSSLYRNIKSLKLNKLEFNLTDNSEDELGELARKFKEMTGRLREQLVRERRLISTISHDLKTPLTSIIGYAEVIRDEVYFNEVDKKDTANIIYHKASYLGQLLDKLLELSKIQSPSFSLMKEKVDLVEFLRVQLLSFLPQLEKNKFTVDTDLPAIPLYVLIDSERMERVISNLINNVLKHAIKGKYLGISLKQTDRWAEISIIDKGDGIAKTEKEKIEKNLYCENRNSSNSKERSGLGLIIIWNLIQAHQGEIDIKSEAGKGTEIVIKLPV